MTTRSLLAALIFTHAALASAETADEAAARGKHALKAGRIHEACDAFATSDKLAPAVATELSLAACYEQDGKPASAARTYRAAADKDTDGPRRRTSLAKAAKLETRAPRLHLAIEPMPAGLVVSVDGMQVAPGDDPIVDTGPHNIVVTAPGYEGHTAVPVDREREVVPVKIQLEPHADAAPPAPAAEPAPALAPAPAPALAPMSAVTPAPHDEAPVAADHRKRNGIILGAAGIGVLAGAVISYEAGSNKFDDAAKLCPDQTCASDADLAKGKSLYSDGHTLRGLSIGMGIGSAVLIAAGGYLMMTGHHEESHVAVNVDPSGAGVTYSARF
jgi:hypothetical protein